jgi:ribulose-phosphate 3-epimerase
MKKIIPAILTDNLGDIKSKLEKIQSVTDWVQIDIMDHTLVDNVTVLPRDISNLALLKGFCVELHLMVKNPETYFEECQKMKAQRVMFHLEAGNTKKILSKAQTYHFQVGLALNPETPVTHLMPYIKQMDVVLLMSVNPGFQGQVFMLKTLDKIRELKKLAPHLTIEVDGGVNLDNIAMISDAGADYFVVGSGLFSSRGIKKRFKELELKTMYHA